jgi:DNA-binding NarL/FixJ family response regulator
MEQVVARTSILDRLDETQRAVTRGKLADAKRREAIYKLWCQGYSQSAIAERLTIASIAEGGEPVTENVVHKVVRDMKKEKASS